MMQQHDWGLGEMMKAIEEAGIADNTIVIFTSDNGPTKTEYAKPYRGTKYVTFEGGHRVPFIVHWPATIKAGDVSGANAKAMDLFPTLSEIIGAPMPKDRTYDGVSLLPVLEGNALLRPGNEPFFYYNCENLQAVRMGDWKLHLPRKAEQAPFWDKNKDFRNLDKAVLYSLQDDPGETTDLASEQPKVVRDLMQIADNARKELGEYLKPGEEQRPTGSIHPQAPVISNEKDWNRMPAETAAKLDALRKERHPRWKPKKR